jgi:hypothetical protein
MKEYRTLASQNWDAGTPHPGYAEYINGKPTGVVVSKGAISFPLTAEVGKTVIGDVTYNDEVIQQVRDSIAAAQAQVPNFYKRIVLSFDWLYGADRIELDTVEEALGYRRKLFKIYPATDFKNWKLAEETIFEKLLDLPEEHVEPIVLVGPRKF